jgi:Tol biopolymer transport system component/imidazolonepropionase-like amidohydrolase
MSSTVPEGPCDCPPGLSRRQFLSLGVLAGAALLEGWSPLVQALEAPPADEPAWGDTPVVLREGTNLAIALSPDRKTLAMDLQGILWSLPLEGGTARRLSGYLHDIARPQWTPDARSIVFQSYRDGGFQLWMINADGRDLRQLTAGEFDCREPSFSPDGRELAFASDRSGHYAIYVIDLASGAVRRVVETGKEDGEPVWSPDGQRIAFSSGGAICSIAASGDLASLRVEYAGPGASAPAWLPDAQSLTWRVLDGSGRDMRSSRLYHAGQAITDVQQDVFPAPVVWLDAQRFLYTADGKILQRTLADARTQAIAFEATVSVTAQRNYVRKVRDLDPAKLRAVRGISFPVISPDGERVAFGALNQLWILQRGQAKPRQLTHDSYAKLGPAWSPDGQQLVYASDRGGLMQLWLHDLKTQATRVLTHELAGLKYASWSPDGKRIACHTHDGWLSTIDLASGEFKRVMRQTVWSGRPHWSPDGTQIALAAVRPYSARYREGLSCFLTVKLADGSTLYQTPAPGVSLDIRNVNGPLWSADGRSFFYTLNGVLHVSKLDAQGRVEGVPRALSNEPADALSLSADGRRLLYLAHGVLRMAHLDGTRITQVETLPLDLHWRVASPPGLTVVHAGRFWDGRSESARENVDILVRGQRIVAIEPHRAQRSGVRWVDASTQTVIPGLHDMHTHREMGIQNGDREPRIFLAYGITTTRGLGENAYLTLENKESVDAGLRIGPRHFATGEALEGSRVFWDGMRPVRDEAALKREFVRAKALDYDLIKCYVRLPPNLQQKATEMAHAMGVPITSHYLFPAVVFGADGFEHMGGTDRFGYSRVGSQLGVGYQDVLAIAAGARCFRTPTLFGIETLLADTPDDVLKDARVQRLLPPWERPALERIAKSGKAQPLRVTARQMDAVLAMHKQGVKIICGSDYPIVMPGLSLHLNLRAMVRFGMRPVDALRTATSVAGEVLAQGTGVLEAGALADMVFVDGDPLARIEDAAKVQAVMLGGRVYRFDELLAPFAQETQTTAQLNASDFGQAQLAADDPYWWHDAHWAHVASQGCCGAQA